MGSSVRSCLKLNAKKRDGGQSLVCQLLSTYKILSSSFNTSKQKQNSQEERKEKKKGREGRRKERRERGRIVDEM